METAITVNISGQARERQKYFKLKIKPTTGQGKDFEDFFIKRLTDTRTNQEGEISFKETTMGDLVAKMSANDITILDYNQVAERLFQILENRQMIERLDKKKKHIVGFYRDAEKGTAVVYIFFSISEMWASNVMRPFLPPQHSYVDTVYYLP